MKIIKAAQTDQNLHLVLLVLKGVRPFNSTRAGKEKLMKFVFLTVEGISRL